MKHISPAYSQFRILKLDDLYRSEIANFMLKHSNNTLPEPLNSHFSQSTDIHSYYTKSIFNLNYHFPSFKGSKLQRSFKYQGVKIWNENFTTLKYRSYSKFKIQFTNLLIDQYSTKISKIILLVSNNIVIQSVIYLASIYIALYTYLQCYLLFFYIKITSSFFSKLIPTNLCPGSLLSKTSVTRCLLTSNLC